MSTRYIREFDSVSKILRTGPNSGIGVVSGQPYMRTSEGLISLGGVAPGTAFYLDAVNGSNSNDGLSPAKAKATLAAAYALMTTGANDVLFVIGNGANTGSVRISANFDWAKNACHLVGVAAPSALSQRARIATTGSDTAFANFFTVSGNGCIFQNLQFWHGFNTGTTAQIALTISGSRNVFLNTHIAGMGDTESGNDAGSRCVKITGGENLFEGCTIGIDTVVRSAANASVELASGTARNVFKDCVFPFFTDDATVLGILGNAAAAADRFHLFERCLFINAIKSTSTTMSALATLAASVGGLLLFKDCTLVGITEFGTDATSRGQIYVDGGTVTAATSGVAVNPT